LGEVRRNNRKALKRQEKILEEMKDGLDKLSNIKNPHTELVNFLLSQFNTLLNTCLNYTKLLNNITDNYANCIKHSAAEKTLEHIIHIQEVNILQTKNHLADIIKRVTNV